MTILNKEAIMTTSFPWITIIVGVAILIISMAIDAYIDDDGVFLIDSFYVSLFVLLVLS